MIQETSAGYLIYSGIMPLLKTFIAIFLGWILAWRGLFTPAASKGASQLTMNIALPCLIFSNIVPAFTPQNVSALAPLFLLALFYMLVGLLFGLIIREICYVPRNFWYGIIIATAMSNWGNLPNSIVLSVTQNAPFDPSIDPALGVSYVSVFSVVSNAVFWVFGAKVITWDYRPDVPQDQEAYRRVSWRQKPIGKYLVRILSGSGSDIYSDSNTAEANTSEVTKTPGELEKSAGSQSSHSAAEKQVDTDVSLSGQVAARLSTHPSRPRRLSSDSVTIHSPASGFLSSNSTLASGSRLDLPTDANSVGVYRYISVIKKVWDLVWDVINPITASMIIALSIALVPSLKALFVDATASGGPSFTGPDGNPPLAFIQDTAVFVGAITVPVSLVLLGAAFARMRRPSDMSQLPLSAIFAVTIVKLVVLPVCGIFLVQALVSRGIIPQESRAERFVAMLLSGTPTAINQVIVAQACSTDEDGGISTLSAFLLLQYICMFISSAAITAISLALIR